MKIKMKIGERLFYGCIFIGFISVFIEGFIQNNYSENFPIVTLSCLICGIYSWRVSKKYSKEVSEK